MSNGAVRILLASNARGGKSNIASALSPSKIASVTGTETQPCNTKGKKGKKNAKGY